MSDRILSVLDYTLGLTAGQVASEIGAAVEQVEGELAELFKRGLAYSQKLNLERRWFKTQHGGYAA